MHVFFRILKNRQLRKSGIALLLALTLAASTLIPAFASDDEDNLPEDPGNAASEPYEEDGGEETEPPESQLEEEPGTEESEPETEGEDDADNEAEEEPGDQDQSEESGKSGEAGEAGEADEEDSEAGTDGGSSPSEDAEGSPVLSYDAQPESAADVLDLLETFDGNFDALPRWEFPIEESWIPAGWTQTKFEDEETGAHYWRLDVIAFGIAPTALDIPVVTGVQLEQAIADILADDGTGTIQLADNAVISLDDTVALSGTLDLTFTGNNATITSANGKRHFEVASSADITIDLGDVTLDGGGNGGGFKINNTGAVTLTGGTITNCYNQYGGTVESRGSFTLADGLIDNNRATAYGGGVYITGVNGAFSMEDGVISNNTADGGSGLDDASGGGISAHSNSTVTLNGGTIENNQASANGGGIVNFDSKLYINDGILITGNTSPNGGGLMVSGGTTVMTGGDIDDNTSPVGGGIYQSGGNLTITGGAVDNNNSTLMGGGLHVMFGTAIIGGNASISGNNSGLGGGIYINSSADPLILQGNAVISGNTATENNGGGGVYVANNRKLIMNGGLIEGNIVNSLGAGVMVFQGTLELNGGEIRSNTGASAGGGVYLYRGTLTMAGGSIHGHTASRGGAVYQNDGTITISNGSIYNNSAVYGGGLYQSIGSFTMSGGSFSGNTASSDGGAIHTPDLTKVTVSGSAAFTGNSAQRLYLMDDADDITTHTTQITAPGPFSSGTQYAYNNYDILYTKEPTTPAAHTVTFDANGGTLNDAATQSVIPGGYATKPANPERDGYRFDGWATIDNTAWEFDTMAVNQDITLYAQWTKLHTVVFNANGGTLNDAASQSIPLGGYASEPADPARTSYIFDGWYTEQVRENGTKWVFGTMPVTDDITLYAQWTKVHTVTFDEAGGSYKPSTQSIVNGQTATQPTKPTKTGYSLEGWYLKNTDTQWDFTDPVKSDLDLVARWTPDTYTVKFDAAGGSPTPDDQSLTYGATATKPATEPTQRGYKFEYWYYINENSPWNFDTLITGNMTLHAKWSQKVYTISYDLNGGDGTTPASDSHVHQDEVYVPEQGDITRDGYTFLGWSKSPTGNDTIYKAKEDTYNFLMPTRSFTLYAVWRADSGYTVTVEHYQYQGDFSTSTPVLVETDDPVSLSYGDSFTATPKSYTGYLYMAGVSQSSVASITGPVTLKLYYQKMDGYTIVYNTNVVDGRTTLEVLDRRTPDAAYTWAQFLQYTEPKLYYGGEPVANVTFTSANFDGLNLRELTRGVPYQIEIQAVWNGGSLVESLSLDVVDTTPPQLTVTRSTITLSSGEIPGDAAYLAAKAGLLAQDNYDTDIRLEFSFVGTDFSSINWAAQDTEYVMYVDAYDQSGNKANPRGVIIIQTPRSSGGGNSSGGTDRPDDLDGRYAVLDDDGVPLGFYVQDDDGNWTYINADDVPLGTLPQTGDTRRLGLAVLCMSIGLAGLLHTGQKRKAR